MDKVVFIDFDGTITKVDTCAAMVKAFAKDGWEEINILWEKKQLSTKACADMTFKLFHAGIDDIKKLMESVEIDDYFKEFLDFCRGRGYRMYVLSDGYDFCIDTVFKKYGVEVPYYANRLLYESGLSMECPHQNPSCGCCGTCKTSLMKSLKGQRSQVLYIGDGYSDTCPAAQADVVFAKGALYNFCLSKGIKATHFDDFADVITYLR